MSRVCSGENGGEGGGVETPEQRRAPPSPGFIALCCHLADH